MSGHKQTKETFDKVQDYLHAEIGASLKDYELLQRLNDTAASTFGDYIVVAQKIAKNVDKINESQLAKTRLDNLVATIEQMDAKVSSLESLAYKIDAYSKRLEDAFRTLNT